MAELADAPDLKSGAPQGAYGFDPRPGHPHKCAGTTDDAAVRLLHAPVRIDNPVGRVADPAGRTHVREGARGNVDGGPSNDSVPAVDRAGGAANDQGPVHFGEIPRAFANFSTEMAACGSETARKLQKTIKETYAS